MDRLEVEDVQFVLGRVGDALPEHRIIINTIFVQYFYYNL